MKIKNVLRKVLVMLMAVIIMVTSTAAIALADYQTTPEVNGKIGFALPMLIRSDPTNSKPYINVLLLNHWSGIYYRVVFSSSQPKWIYCYNTLQFYYNFGNQEEVYDVKVSGSTVTGWTKTETIGVIGASWIYAGTCELLYSNSGCIYSTKNNNGTSAMYSNQADGKFKSAESATWRESLAKANSAYVTPPPKQIEEYTGIMPPMPSLDDCKITLQPIDISTRLIDDTANPSATGVQVIDDIINFLFHFFAGIYNKSQEVVTDLWNNKVMPVAQVIVNVINRVIEILYPALSAIYGAISYQANSLYGVYLILRDGLKAKLEDLGGMLRTISDFITEISTNVFKFLFGDIELLKTKLASVQTNAIALIPDVFFEHEGGGGGHFSVMKESAPVQPIDIDEVGRGNITLGGRTYEISFLNNAMVVDTMSQLRPYFSNVVKVLIAFSDIMFLYNITRTQKKGA